MVPSTEAVKESGKVLRTFFVVALCSLALVSTVLAESPSDSSSDQAPSSDGPAATALASQIAELRKEKHLVSLGAMVMVDGNVVASAVDGERKKGSGVRPEIGDRWHLGSITKSITATMIARLVESGKMQWSDSIGAVVRDLEPGFELVECMRSDSACAIQAACGLMDPIFEARQAFDMLDRYTLADAIGPRISGLAQLLIRGRGAAGPTGE